jgi:hypothetical protein
MRTLPAMSAVFKMSFQQAVTVAAMIHDELLSLIKITGNGSKVTV